MSNWKNIDGVWINFDLLSQIWIKHIGRLKFFEIWTAENGEEEGFPLFNEVFKTQAEAQIFINNFMNGKND